MTAQCNPATDVSPLAWWSATAASRPGPWVGAGVAQARRPPIVVGVGWVDQLDGGAVDPLGCGRGEVVGAQRTAAGGHLPDNRITDRAGEQIGTEVDPLAQHVGEAGQSHDRAGCDRSAVGVVGAAFGMHLRNERGGLR